MMDRLLSGWKILVAIVGTAIFAISIIVIGLGLGIFSDDPARVDVPREVTAPFNVTADLRSDGWHVHQEFKVDEASTKALLFATRLPPETAASFIEALPIAEARWRVDRFVDSSPVYVNDVVIPVEFGRFGVAEADLPTFRLPLAGFFDPKVIIVPRAGSSVELTAPRGALARTSPAADQSADVTGGEVQTKIAIDDSTEELTTTVLSNWWRSPPGVQLYGFLSWPLLPWLVGMGLAGLLVWLRRQVAALAIGAWNYFLGKEARTGESAPVSGPPIPSRRKKSRVAGGRHRR
jgi:hypothetical protein